MKVTEDSLQPYYDKILDAEDQIRDQKQNIRNIKGSIIKNQATI